MRSLFLVIALLSIASADKWALFVSGNSGWFNYCISSTICRGFDILHQAGVAEDHIVYMGFNKTFDSPQNPFPGKIFTDQDPDGPGVDYAAECRPHMDYGDEHVSAELFMATLSGNKEEAKKLTGIENPKVIESGPEDTIFVYYMDHGAIGFCEVGKSDLQEDVLINTINQMFEKKQYKQIVFYFEACHSGSMFRKLEQGKNVYAMTGSDTEHSAWMCNCPPHDKVNGKSMGTCLSAWYDNMWMEEVMKKGCGHQPRRHVQDRARDCGEAHGPERLSVGDLTPWATCLSRSSSVTTSPSTPAPTLAPASSTRTLSARLPCGQRSATPPTVLRTSRTSCTWTP